MIHTDKPTVQIPMTNYTINETSGITVNCQATGNPLPSVTWVKKGIMSTLSVGNILTFTNVTKHEAGTYLCQAENSLGVASTSISIMVQCKYIIC